MHAADALVQRCEIAEEGGRPAWTDESGGAVLQLDELVRAEHSGRLERLRCRDGRARVMEIATKLVWRDETHGPKEY